MIVLCGAIQIFLQELSCSLVPLYLLSVWILPELTVEILYSFLMNIFVSVLIVLSCPRYDVCAVAIPDAVLLSLPFSALFLSFRVFLHRLSVRNAIRYRSKVIFCISISLMLVLTQIYIIVVSDLESVLSVLKSSCL